MNCVQIPVPLPNSREAKLMFRQWQPRGDWICQATDETITDLQDLLAGLPLSWQETDTGVSQ